MAFVSTYLNFERNTEEAFEYYKSVFGTEYMSPIMRIGETPPIEGAPPLSKEDLQLVMHVSLPITGGHILMGTDSPESFGFTLVKGNNVHIMLSPDTREETDRLFVALSDGGQVTVAMQDMFWGAYYGSCTDRFGIHWMFNCHKMHSKSE